jgi:hypothetical protein
VCNPLLICVNLRLDLFPGLLRHLLPLDFHLLSDNMSDMKISTRSLVRDFPRIKAAARKGQTVEIRDGRTGEAFLLTAKPTQTFGELARSAKGVYSGPRDLSSREGFDA